MKVFWNKIVEFSNKNNLDQNFKDNLKKDKDFDEKSNNEIISVV